MVSILVHHESVQNAYVRKNVTLPAWLERAAGEKGLNSSRVLQSVLKEQPGTREVR